MHRSAPTCGDELLETPTNHRKPRHGGKRGVLELLQGIREREIRPQDISHHERRVCVAYLRMEGYTQEEMAQIFDVHRRTISRDEKAIRKETARLVDDLDVRAVAGRLMAYARHLTSKALKKKDYALAWRIQRELVADLQTFGYVPKVAERYDVRVGTFVDVAKLAMEQQEPEEILDVGEVKALPGHSEEKPGEE